VAASGITKDFGPITLTLKAIGKARKKVEKCAAKLPQLTGQLKNQATASISKSPSLSEAKGKTSASDTSVDATNGSQAILYRKTRKIAEKFPQ